MTTLEVITKGDGCWNDLRQLEEQGRLRNYMGSETRVEMALLPGGTSGGRPSVTFRVNAPDGTVILFELTWRLLYTAVKSLISQAGIPS